MTGWKTLVSGIGLILTGVIGLVMHFVDPLSSVAMTFDVAIAVIFNGFGVIGIGHKVEKVGKAVKDNA